MSRNRLRLLVATLIVAMTGSPSYAQLGELVWDGGIGVPGMSDRVEAIAVFDDGAAPGPYAGCFSTQARCVSPSQTVKSHGISRLAVGAGTDNLDRIVD